MQILKRKKILFDCPLPPKPKNLVQFALMGKVFLESVIGIKNPRIALMSIGEEAEKLDTVGSAVNYIVEKMK